MRWGRTERGGVAVSFSGNEANHLFLSESGAQFEDVSGISGLDSRADGRALALFDYDRDGWQDIAVVNSNAPTLHLFHNEIGDRGGTGRVLAVRFEGGNHDAAATRDYSNRDGYGAVVGVDLKGMHIVREHRCGEGFGAQNSATLLIGIGGADRAEAVTVRWPGGRVQRIEDVAAGTLLTVYENDADSPDGSGFARVAYHAAGARGAAVARRDVPSGSPVRLDFGRVEPAAELRMYTTTATWCDACKKSLPQLRAIRDAFAVGELAMLGVPVDEDDTPGKLATYVDEYAPAYEMQPQLSRSQIQRVVALIVAAFDSELLPSSVVTDRAGRVLETIAGVPSISRLRKLAAMNRGGSTQPAPAAASGASLTTPSDAMARIAQ